MLARVLQLLARGLQLLARVLQLLSELGLAFCTLQGLDGGGAKVISVSVCEFIALACVV